MFIPKLYRKDDFDFAKSIINANPFGQLISHDSELRSTHSMFTIKGVFDDFHLETHISNANPQAKFLEENHEVLCSFLGTNAYISSSWHEKTNVSTYNYQAIQIKGKIRKMSETELYLHLKEITQKHESIQKCPMTFEKMGDEFVKKEMKGTQGYIITPIQMDCANKLSQNRNDKDYENIILNLENQNDAKSLKMGKCMRDELLNRK